MKIDVVCGGGELPVYLFNRDIRSFRFVPVPESVLSSYDAVLFYDELVAQSTDGNAYALMFDAAGLSYTDEDCKPYLKLKRGDELEALSAVFGSGPSGMVSATSDFVLLGLASEANSRNLRASQWRDIIDKLNEEAKGVEGFRIVGVSHNDQGFQLQRAIGAMPNYVPLHGILNPRHFAALARIGMLTITVDTSYLHLAGAVGCPTVALMSTVPPESRVSTYPACASVYAREACPHAPCHYKRSRFLEVKGDDLFVAPCYTPQRIQCDILASLDMRAVELAMDVAMSRDQRDFNPLPV